MNIRQACIMAVSRAWQVPEIDLTTHRSGNEHGCDDASDARAALAYMLHRQYFSTPDIRGILRLGTHSRGVDLVQIASNRCETDPEYRDRLKCAEEKAIRTALSVRSSPQNPSRSWGAVWNGARWTPLYGPSAASEDTNGEQTR